MSLTCRDMKTNRNCFSVWFLLFFGHLAKYCRNIQSSIRAKGYKRTKINNENNNK